MTTFEVLKRGLTILLAAGGLAGPVAVIVYTTSRASADDLEQLKANHAVLQRAHDDLADRVALDRAETIRRLELIDNKQDHMIDILETRSRRH